MAAVARKLKVLVIHDTPFKPVANESIVLETEDLQLYDIGLEDELNEGKVLSNWKEAVKLLNRLASSEPVSDQPDILLADCHFERDERDPPTLDHNIDSRGLLYGIAFGAFFLGGYPRKPFGLAIYSEDLGLAAHDGYSVTFYSLLEALQAKVPEPDTKALKEKMKNTPGGLLPSDAVAEALGNYRHSFFRAFDDYLIPDTDSFEHCLWEIEHYVKDPNYPLQESLCLNWKSYPHEQDSVLLSSFLADYREDEEWCHDLLHQDYLKAQTPNTQQESVLYHLKVISDEKNLLKQIYQPVTKNIHDYFFGGVETIDWGRGNHGDHRKILAFIIFWALDRCLAKKRNVEPSHAKPICEYVLPGKSSPQKQIDRALAKVLFNHISNGKFLTMLDQGNWELMNPEFKDLTIRYLETLNRQETIIPLTLYRDDGLYTLRAFWPDSLH